MHYFCWTMRELRKHTRRKIVSRETRVKLLETCVQTELSTFTSQQITMSRPFASFLFPLSPTSPSDIYVPIKMADNELFLSLHLHSLSSLCVIYHSESMFTSNDTTTHALCCLPLCLHPSVSLPVATNKDITNEKLDEFDETKKGAWECLHNIMKPSAVMYC